MIELTAEINRAINPFDTDDFNPYTVTRPVPVKATVEQVAHLLGATFTKANE